LLASVILMIVTACGKIGPLLGVSADSYINANDPAQTLELNAKGTVKGLFARNVIGPSGHFVLAGQEKPTTGEFTFANGTYVLKPKDRELKVVLKQDGNLRDETGTLWKHQFHSHSLRPPDVADASR